LFQRTWLSRWPKCQGEILGTFFYIQVASAP
jgi:hypothetical protein